LLGVGSAALPAKLLILVQGIQNRVVSIRPPEQDIVDAVEGLILQEDTVDERDSLGIQSDDRETEFIVVASFDSNDLIVPRSNAELVKDFLGYLAVRANETSLVSSQVLVVVGGDRMGQALQNRWAKAVAVTMGLGELGIHQGSVAEDNGDLR